MAKSRVINKSNIGKKASYFAMNIEPLLHQYRNDLGKNRIATFLIVTLLVLGILYRLFVGVSHFSQHDEAFHLLTQMHEYQKQSYVIHIGRTDERLNNTEERKNIYLLSSSPFSYKFEISPDQIRSNPVLYSLKIAHQTTYAPLHSLLAGTFINNDAPYHKKLTQLRLPGLIFSVLSLILFSFLMLKLGKDFVTALLPTAIFCLSIMPIVYSAQGIPYSILIFFVVLQLVFLQYIASHPRLRAWELIIATILSICIGYSHWMMSLVNVSFYLSIFVIVALYGEKRNIGRNLFRLALSSFCFVIAMIPGILLFVLKAARHVRGRQDFSLGFNMQSPFELLKRFYLIAKSNLSFQPEGLLNMIILCILIALILGGLLCTIIAKRSKEKMIALYGIVVLAIYTVAGFFHLVPLTPTRHTIFLTPILLCLVGYSIYSLKSKIQNSPRLFHSIIYSITLIIILTSVLSFPKICNDRRMRFSNAMIQEISNMVDKHKIQCVVCYDSFEAIVALDEKLDVPFKLYRTAPAYADNWKKNIEPFESFLFVSTHRSLGASNSEFMDLVKYLKPNFTLIEKIAHDGISMDVVSENNHTNVYNNLYVSVILPNTINR